MARSKKEQPASEHIMTPRQPAPPLVRLLSYQVGNMQQVGTRPYQEDSFAFANALDVLTLLWERGKLPLSGIKIHRN